MTTDVSASKEQILRILNKYVTDTRGADAADGMVLQILVDGKWVALGNDYTIRYATVNKDNG